MPACAVCGARAHAACIDAVLQRRCAHTYPSRLACRVVSVGQLAAGCSCMLLLQQGACGSWQPAGYPRSAISRAAGLPCRQACWAADAPLGLAAEPLEHANSAARRAAAQAGPRPPSVIGLHRGAPRRAGHGGPLSPYTTSLATLLRSKALVPGAGRKPVQRRNRRSRNSSRRSTSAAARQRRNGAGQEQASMGLDGCMLRDRCDRPPAGGCGPRLGLAARAPQADNQAPAGHSFPATGMMLSINGMVDA